MGKTFKKKGTPVFAFLGSKHEAGIFKTFKYCLLVCKTVNEISKIIKNNCNCVLVQTLFSSKTKLPRFPGNTLQPANAIKQSQSKNLNMKNSFFYFQKKTKVTFDFKLTEQD
ncbi:hypothetical protein EK904_000326 [Melospiza melodia maxima]|nr:hypothetical protein EK904_000326 [Melospiza melodia maxima]